MGNAATDSLILSADERFQVSLRYGSAVNPDREWELTQHRGGQFFRYISCVAFAARAREYTELCTASGTPSFPS